MLPHPPVRLADLIDHLPVTLVPPSAASVQISAVTEDSRTVTPGALFIARPGGRHDGIKFINDAIGAGAAAILTTAPEGNATGQSASVAILTCADAREVIRIGAIIAERLHASPSSQLRVVGVTGTNGKSTVAHMVHRLLKSAGVGCGLIGTVEIDDGHTATKAAMTTPPATETSRLLAAMRNHNCAGAAMEVSSHALHQGRCDGLRFACAVFTNLTGDHLDYHNTMDEYARCKAMLFAQLEPGALAVVNADDPAHERMIADCKAQVIRTSITRPDAHAHARVLGVSAHGTRAIYHGDWGAIEATSPFIGEHNVSNALQAMVCAHHLGLSREQLRTGLDRLTTPAGRLECVSTPGDGCMVLVDYAHSDDSLAHALASVRPVAQQNNARMICVFGCGGDRDKTKRPRMGRAAANGADLVFITSDNPRTEQPEAIIDEIRAGMDDAMLSRTHSDPDRRRAIYAAISQACAGPGGDVLVIAGKGHEDYQILPDGRGGTTRIDFDDRLVAREALAARRSAAVEAKPQRRELSDFWTPLGIARATGGKLVGNPQTPISGVCTDTRSITPGGGGGVFVAVVGERFDAHDFIPEAVAKGAACVMTHRDATDLPVPIIRVHDTAAALMDLGSAWRRELTKTRVIAVTGSNGKTTTCRMIDAILGATLHGRASIKSFNNAIGVPLTVLDAKPTDDYLVAEAGMNAPGEMEPLSRILSPDIAVIASIGRAHIGAFDDGLPGIAREKAALATHLAPDGVIIATADSPELRQVLRDDPRVVWVGEADDATVRVEVMDTQHPDSLSPRGGACQESTGEGFRFRLKHNTPHPSDATRRPPSSKRGEEAGAFTVNAPGRHNALNAAIAVVVARKMGLGDDAIRAGLASFTPAPMRMQRTAIHGVTIINDAYNANPESMAAALRHFATTPACGRKIAVLGQMLEMGDASDALHAEIGRFISVSPAPPDLLITVGPGARAIALHAAVRHEHFDTLDHGAERRIASMFEPGDLVLLKGSRGVGLERIIPAIGTPGRCSTTST